MNEESFIEIPSSLMRQWEQEAIDQRLPYTEFGSFLDMKERLYLESLEEEVQEDERKVFTNASCNKLTEYGNSLVVERMLRLSPVERAVRLSLFNFTELKKRLAKGFADAEQKESFVVLRDDWFASLKDKMKDLRISKEVLESFGMSWNEAKSFAYQTI